MIKFLIKGLLRDRHRSLLPIIVVSIGVFLTVLFHCWLSGIMGDMIDMNAKFSTGHVKIMSKSYSENINQIPNDLALTGVEDLLENTKKDYPDISWVERIQFGGLLDVPDENGETKSQGPTMGMAIDLFSDNKLEISNLNIEKSLQRGKLPENPKEILISEEFAQKLDIGPGANVTLIASTMYGSMSMSNFIVSGTIKFGITAMDRGTIVVDINDARLTLDMEDAAGEILGFFNSNIYEDELAIEITNSFNSKYSNADEYSPVMLRLKEQNNLASMLDLYDSMSGIIISVFVLAMSIVLWNSGLLGGLRRYSEVGIRLAIGENKGHVYRSMITESIAIGVIGSVIGTAIGLSLSYYMQSHGMDFSSFAKNSTMMMPGVFHTSVNASAWYIGFFPGLFSTVLGTCLSGIGIYKRKTAQLFKELEI
ncbi:ABC transporter permease [Bacteroidota bacterium]